MQSQNRLFDDLVKMMNGAAGTVAGMAREGEGSMRERMREWIGGQDFAARHSGDRASGAVHHLDEVVEQAILRLHFKLQ